MKTIRSCIVLAVVLLTTTTATRSRAQSSDLIQLMLDIEKLTQLKGILTDMKTGYEIINGGYNQVKQIASGNFSIHSVFLNGLLAVNPEIAKYGRVGDIVLDQAAIVNEYQRYYRQFKSGGNFNSGEIGYMANVYGQLLRQSFSNLDQLTTVLAAGRLRMSDDERIKAIDRIYADTSDQLQFLRHFNRQANVLALQRQKEQHGITVTQKLY
jgi:hypothetical protein